MHIGTISAITKLGGTALGIVDQFVEDKDLKQKLAIKQLELTYGLIEKILNTATVPWVDAMVKVMSTLVVLSRPIGSFLLTAAGIYMHINNVPLDPAVNYALDAAFPTWMGAREVHKKRETELLHRSIDKADVFSEYRP